MTTTDGVYIDERLVKRVDASGPKSAQMVLAEPEDRHRRLRGRAWGDPARGPGVRAQRRRRGAERDGRSSRAARDRHARAARGGEAGGRGGRAAQRVGGPERRRPARPGDAPALQRQRDPVLDAGQARSRRTLGAARTQGGGAGAERTRRDDGDQGRPPHDADRVGAHAARHVRRQGAHDGAERDGRRRGRACGGRPPARHPSGAALVHHLDLPGARAAQRVRPRRREGRSSTTPTTPPDSRRWATSSSGSSRTSLTPNDPARRAGPRTSASRWSPPRGTGATRTCWSSDASPRGTSTR